MLGPFSKKWEECSLSSIQEEIKERSSSAPGQWSWSNKNIPRSQLRYVGGVIHNKNVSCMRLVFTKLWLIKKFAPAPRGLCHSSQYQTARSNNYSDTVRQGAIPWDSINMRVLATSHFHFNYWRKEQTLEDDISKELNRNYLPFFLPICSLKTCNDFFRMYFFRKLILSGKTIEQYINIFKIWTSTSTTKHKKSKPTFLSPF